MRQTLTHNQRQATILVAEDNEDNLIYISYALSLFGYRGIVTGNAAKIINLAQEYQPDLIILDIQMPYLSGIDLIQILKRDWLTRQIPIVAVTALARESEQKQILAAGFKACLVKPFFLEDLQSIISLHIRDTSIR